MENTIRVNFNLDKDTHFQVKQLALNKHTTATSKVDESGSTLSSHKYT